MRYKVTSVISHLKSTEYQCFAMLQIFLFFFRFVTFVTKFSLVEIFLCCEKIHFVTFVTKSADQIIL